MASLQSNSTFSVEHVHHLTGEAFLAWYLHIVRTSTIAKNRHLNIVLRAEPTQQTVYVVAPTLQLLIISLAKLFFQTPLDRRGMASLQGNCTSSNTTRQARHASLAWSLYIVRTSNIAKNRHKHRFASGTVSKNRHLYRIRCDTFGPALARKNTKPWRSTPIHV